MKPVRFLSTIFGTAAMFLLFGISAPVHAFQEEHPQDARPAEGQAHDQETKPSDDAAKPTPSKPPKQENVPKDEKPPADANAPKDNHNTRTQTESKTTTQHGRVENGRIPDAELPFALWTRASFPRWSSASESTVSRASNTAGIGSLLPNRACRLGL